MNLLAHEEWTELEAFVDAFEESQRRGGDADPGGFLPPPGDSRRGRVLCELLRVDLEYRWRRGQRPPLEEYRSRYSEAFAEQTSAAQVAYEHYRLRRQAGERPRPEEYADRFGFDLSHWPVEADASTCVAEGSEAEGSEATTEGGLARQWPAPGEEYAGFRIERELGRGAFARVFLARQTGLAERRVALKVSTQPLGEPERMARLQHTNIVPIYSLHAWGPWQAACMPYFGDRTLAADLARRAAGDRTALPAAREIRGVLETVAELAKALAHAHERGIVHRDIKPANILLADDGRPMLLDFNLAGDRSQENGARQMTMGGTLPYMAPEHVRALCGERVAIDARCDLFSLGVVFYEMLAARLPFPRRFGPLRAVADQLIADRLTSAPSPRAVNPAVTPAVDAIVRRCLAPDPRDRYRTATELQCDLERHLRNEPLQYAREPSPVERTRKWARRHPRLSSAGSLAAVALVGLVSLAALAWNRAQRIERLHALDEWRAFSADRREALYALNQALSIDARLTRQGVERAREALRRFGAAESPAWLDAPPASLLPQVERNALAEQAQELLALIDSAEHDRRQAGALALGTELPHSTLELNRPLELYRAGRRDALAGRYVDAAKRLRESLRHDPAQFWSWLVLGRCYDELARDADAANCYSVCISLDPESAGARYNRGLALLRQRQYDEAEWDFDAALLLDPRLADAYINRGLARLARQEALGAELDFTHALDLDGNPRAYFMRSRARTAQGNAAEAEADRQRGLAAEPVDELGWIARGMARLPKEPEQALADFDAALDMNPRCLLAWQNKAALLSQTPGREREAIDALSKAIEFYPDCVPARRGRAVVAARLGDRQLALDDIRQALVQDRSGPTLYEAACAFAQCSRKNEPDSTEALALLSQALQVGYGHEHLATDSDLDPLRNRPEFEALRQAAVRLQTQATK